MLLSDYVEILRRRWWVIVLTAFVAAATGYAFSKWQFSQGAQFRSEATYQVVANQLDNGLYIVLQNKMNSFRNLALAPKELEKISAHLGLDRDADWLLNKHVAVQVLPDEQKMVVQVTYPDPSVAPKLADAIGANMVGLVAAQNASLEGSSRINVTELQSARPAALYWPQTKIIVAFGGVLGLPLGLLLAFGREALDKSLKSPADVERFVGLTTLGKIPTVE